MTRRYALLVALSLVALAAGYLLTSSKRPVAVGKVTTEAALTHDTSARLAPPDEGDNAAEEAEEQARGGGAPSEAPKNAEGAKEKRHQISSPHHAFILHVNSLAFLASLAVQPLRSGL